MTRVLIVDDQQENLYYLRALLAGHGWAVDSAIHGADALEKARRARPDLIISDLLMPVMDGYTLLRHWKADARLRDVPFIVHTATYTDADDERLALSLGADAFILKPCEPTDFLARIRQVQASGTTGGGPSLPDAPFLPEKAMLELYNAALIRKLEEKTQELKQSNRALQNDIFEREAVERKLRQNEDLLLIAARVAKLGGWSVELPDRVTWSEQVCGIHEVLPGTVSSLERAIAFCAPEFRQVVRAQIDQCARGGTPFDLEVQIITASGRRMWVRLMGHAERSESGSISRLEGALQDIDERRILEVQLRQAQKMEAIGQLAGGVAHDFNNLLSVILGYTSLILEEADPEERWRDDIEEIRRAGERAAALTRQLLAFGRKQMLQPRVLDVAQVVSGMEKMLRHVAGEDIELCLSLSRSLGRVHADPVQVEQIVMNLVVNARDAMPEGGRLSIEVDDAELSAAYALQHPGVVPGRYVRMAVTDSGTGMDVATRERIFEPFFTTKQQGKGTGLGLSSVFGIVKQSAGHICVDSELDQGTTLTVYLPRTDQAVRPATDVPTPPEPVRGFETLLLVEDDEQVRVMIRTVLRGYGYTVLDAQNGGEAFLICEKYAGPIQLLLTDVIMPRMSGPELAQRLGSMRPEMRVLYISGYAEKSIVHHGVLDADVAFFQKPIVPALLLRKVREVLAARKPAMSPSRPER